VKVAVPVSGMSDLESYVSNKVINGHCDCMFLVNLYRWEWTTIAALIAPRPMLFANSDNDRIFPMDGNRRIIERLRQAYKMHGQPDLVDEYVSKGGHDYRPDLRVAVFQWINKHLKGDTGAVKDATDAPLPGKELRVFAEDKDVPADAINGRIDGTFIAKAEVKLPEAGKFAEWQKGLLTKLREGPFRDLGEVKAATEEFASGINSGFPAFRSLITEGEIRTTLHASKVVIKRDGRYSLTVVEDDMATDQKAMTLVKLADSDTGFWLEPRGIGRTAWSRHNPPNYVERSHAILGRTVDLGRVHDILSIHKRFISGHPANWRIVGRRKAGVLAAYAALLEPRITEVVLVDPPASHRDGPHFLGVQRVLDIPDALGLLAPRKLTLIGAHHPAFDKTAEIYKLAGAADKLVRPLPERLDPRGVTGTQTLSNSAEAAKVLPNAKITFDDASLVVSGRKLGVTGSGKVTIRLAAGAGKPERTIVLDEKKREDLTALRRATRDRAEGFPPEKVRDPVVENGALVIVGGGGLPPGLVNRFVELAGGKQAKIVVLPTAVANPSPRDGFANALRKAGAGKGTILHGNTPDKVESQEYLDAMREATGIWFGGGRQWHFVDAYENTKLLPLMHDVLKRGGVIGGSSAGATIQGEYLCRGGVFHNFDIAYEGYERGFAFLPGVGIDQHFAQRKRFGDMTKLMKLFPQFLGIGLDEATAIVVQGSTAAVVGRSQAHFYDAAKPSHESLKDGERYDLKARKVIAGKKE
jgi:cyanophycinase